MQAGLPESPDFPHRLEENNYHQHKHHNRQHSFEISLEVMLGQIVVEDVIDVGDKGGYRHKHRRDKSDEAVSPLVGMPENENRAYAQRQRRQKLVCDAEQGPDGGDIAVINEVSPEKTDNASAEQNRRHPGAA